MQSPLLRRSLARLALLAFLGAGGCGRSDSAQASPEDVDESTEAFVTDAEYAAFRAPSDGAITEAQVTAFLKTSLLQFDLVRQHSARMHGRYQQMEQRAEKGGTIAGLRNLIDAGRTFTEFGDLIGGSYVRSARSLGYNPAEMEWVRERMGEVAMYLAMKPVHEAAAGSAQEIREQAELLRAQLAETGGVGFTEADVDNMVASANQLEADSREEPVSPEVLASVRVLRKARPAVTEQMWSTIGFTSGATGLMALTGLGDPDDAEAQRKLDEFREIFSDALENRTTAGMEAAGMEAASSEAS